MAKKKSVWSTILKIILGIVGFIALIVVGAYCYLKFALGIDIFDIKSKLDLLNKPVSESTLITEPFNEDDGFGVLESMFGVNDICTREADKTTFNFELFIQSDLVETDKILKDEELASVFSLFFKNVDYTKLGLSDNYADYLSLKQIKFSNIFVDADSTSVDVNYVVKFEMGNYKKELTEGGLVAFLIDTFIPNDIYISSTFNIDVPINSFEDYVVTNKSFLINSLTQQQTNQVLDLVNLISTDDLKTKLPNTVNDIFCDALFGGKGSAGFISSIKDLVGVQFCETESGIAIVIKKV